MHPDRGCRLAGTRVGRCRGPASALRSAEALLPGPRRLHRVRIPDQQSARGTAAAGIQHRLRRPVSARLRHLQPGITTVNFSCPGESTLSFTTPCAWKASGHALHDDYPGSQLDAALAFLTAHRGQVSPITLSLNGNDITAFLQSCPPGDLACIQSGAPAAIAQYRTRLTAILERLRAAAPDAEIILTGAYDPDIGEFSFADPLFTALNNAESMAGATDGPASPTRSRSSTRKETRQPRPPPSALLPWRAPSTTPTPPMPATGSLASLVWTASGYHKLR